MNKIFFFEGTDGSGKTTIIDGLYKYLSKNNLSYQLISKETIPTARKITYIYKYTETNVEVEIFLRIAREFAKAYDIDKTKDYVFVYRAILSLATTINSYNHNWEDFKYSFDLIKNYYVDYITIFCQTPFEIARERISKRALSGRYKLSKKEAKGYEYNHKIYKILYTLKQNNYLVGNDLIIVDTHKYNPSEVVDYLINKIKNNE